MSTASTFSSPLAATVALAREPPPPDENRWLDIVVPEILLFVLATVAVFARVYVRLSIKPKLWLDDWTMFAAYAWTFFGFVTVIMQAQYGLGRHTIYIGEANAIQMMKWNQLARLTFIPCMALAKVSICFFLLRILDSRTHAHFRTYIWLVMGASVVSNIVLLVVWAMQCIPIEATWDPSVEGQCLSQSVVVDVAYVQAGFNLVTDILCALFPVFFFNTAYMRWKTRSALILLAVLGMLTSITAVLRIVYLPDLERLDDASWRLTNVTICALIETKAGIFLGCLPAIKCLWTKSIEILPSISHFTSSGSSRSRSRSRSRSSKLKSWDLMHSPVMPTFDDSTSTLHSTYPHSQTSFRSADRDLDLERDGDGGRDRERDREGGRDRDRDRDRDSFPLQPLHVDRANRILGKGFEERGFEERGFEGRGPDTPGLQLEGTTEAKVMSFV